MKFVLSLFVFLFCFNFSSFADRITSAFKLIEKNNFEKAKSLLDKELEKTPMSAGAYHVYAHYYFSTQNPKQNIDSAYFFINKAIQNYASSDSKALKDWNSEGLSLTSANTHKKEIEASAFKQAQSNNSVQSFQHYLDNYKGASQVNLAMTLRDNLAWENAKNTNTLKAYEAFVFKYPKAIQFKDAIKKRDEIIFEKETSTKTKNAYEAFLNKYPQNVYADEAKDKLFEYMALKHNLNTYLQYLKKYPNSSKSQTAWKWLQSFSQEKMSLQVFLSTYANNPNRNYLEKLSKLENNQYLPIFEDEAYGYINQKGEKVISADYEYIPHEQLCKSIKGNYIKINVNNHIGVIDKLGKTVIEAKYDDIEKIAPGILKVSRNARFGLVHETGFEILPLKYDDVQILNANFIKTKKHRRYGLVSYNGKMIIDNQYSDVFAYNENFIGIRLGKKYAIYSNASLIKAVEENTFKVRLSYDDASLISQKYLKTEKAQKFGLLSADNSFTLPAKYKDIAIQDGFAYATKDSLWTLYNFNGSLLLDTLQDIQLNHKDFFIAKKNNKWSLYDRDTTLITNTTSDSLSIVSDYLIKTNAKLTAVQFLKDSTFKEINLSYFRTIKGEKGDYPNAQIFLHIENRLGKKGLYNAYGNRILSTSYNNFYIWSDSLINVNLLGKYGLVDAKGNIVLKPVYAGLMQNKNSTITTLLNGKYGLFDLRSKKQILSYYQSALKPYFKTDTTSMYCIAKKLGKQGLVNWDNKVVLPFVFSDINYWSDSTALVKGKEAKYRFYNFIKKKFIADSFLYDEVKPTKQTKNLSIAITQKALKYGVVSSKHGEILPNEYDIVYNVGSPDYNIFFAQKLLEDEETHEVLYVTEDKKIIWKQIMSELEYHRLLCE